MKHVTVCVQKAHHQSNLPSLHEQYADTMQEVDPSPFFSNIQVT